VASLLKVIGLLARLIENSLAFFCVSLFLDIRTASIFPTLNLILCSFPRLIALSPTSPSAKVTSYIELLATIRQILSAKEGIVIVRNFSSSSLSSLLM